MTDPRAMVQTMISLASASLGLVAALAWNEAIKALLAMMHLGDSLAGLFSYAIVATVLGSWTAATSYEEFSIVADWDVEVAQGSRIGDPKVRRRAVGAALNIRCSDAGVEIEGELSTRGPIESRQVRIGQGKYATPDAKSPASVTYVVPPEVVTIESVRRTRQPLQIQLPLRREQPDATPRTGHEGDGTPERHDATAPVGMVVPRSTTSASPNDTSTCPVASLRSSWAAARSISRSSRLANCGDTCSSASVILAVNASASARSGSPSAPRPPPSNRPPPVSMAPFSTPPT